MPLVVKKSRFGAIPPKFGWKIRKG